MLRQFFQDVSLLIDLFLSILRRKGMFERKPLKFWYYQTREGISFKLRKHVWDSAILMETWWLNEYLRVLKDIQESGVVIDVGAHIGSFSIYMASKFKKIKVLALEPNPDNFALLQENIKINHLETKIFPVKLALWDKQETISLKLHPDNFGSHSLLVDQTKTKEKCCLVQTICSKKFFEDEQISKCDLLKMDCEGCEYSVILSTPQDVLKKIKNIVLEYHSGGDIRKISQYLQEVGFKTKFSRAIPLFLIGRLVKAPLLYAWQED